MGLKVKKPILVDKVWMEILWSSDCWSDEIERKYRYMNFDVPETVQRFAVEVLRPHVQSLEYKEFHRLKESLRFAIHYFTKEEWISFLYCLQDAIVPVGKNIRESIIIIWIEIFDDVDFQTIELSIVRNISLRKFKLCRPTGQTRGSAPTKPKGVTDAKN